MRDIVFEWYVPYVPDMRKRLIKAVTVSAAIVFFIDAVFFAAGMLIPAVLLAVGGFFVFRSWNYEYEYVYVNGDFTVSKIIRKAKRKDVYHVFRPDIESFTEGRKSLSPGGQALDLTSNRPGACVYTIRAKGQTVYIEPSPEFVEEMRRNGR